LKQSGKSGLFIFQHSCPPIRGIHLYHDSARCFKFNEEIFALLKKLPEINNVFLVSIWRQALGSLSASEETPPTPESSIHLFEQQFSKTLSDLNLDGKHVYVWEPLPGARRNVPESLARAAIDHSDPNLELSKDEYLATFRFFFETLARNDALLTAHLSTSNALCNSGRCSATLAGRPLYFDNNHPAESSSDFWAIQLAKMQFK
jgi:hypothetical protein